MRDGILGLRGQRSKCGVRLRYEMNSETLLVTVMEIERREATKKELSTSDEIKA